MVSSAIISRLEQLDPPRLSFPLSLRFQSLALEGMLTMHLRLQWLKMAYFKRRLLVHAWGTKQKTRNQDTFTTELKGVELPFGRVTHTSHFPRHLKEGRRRWEEKGKGSSQKLPKTCWVCLKSDRPLCQKEEQNCFLEFHISIPTQDFAVLYTRTSYYFYPTCGASGIANSFLP